MVIADFLDGNRDQTKFTRTKFIAEKNCSSREMKNTWCCLLWMVKQEMKYVLLIVAVFAPFEIQSNHFQRSIEVPAIFVFQSPCIVLVFVAKSSKYVLHQSHPNNYLDQ